MKRFFVSPFLGTKRFVENDFSGRQRFTVFICPKRFLLAQLPKRFIGDSLFSRKRFDRNNFPRPKRFIGSKSLKDENEALPLFDGLK